MAMLMEPRSLAAEARRVVRDRILRGELPLGHPISRRRLASELGMSFLPVSEALLRLEFEGLLESRPRAGTRVRIPSEAEVHGHFVVREALEVQAALLFDAAATAGERSELRRLAARVDMLSTHPDRTVYLEVHQKLHRRIAECTRCELLCDEIERTHVLATIWFCAARSAGAGASRSRHQELVKALCSGDAAHAVAAVRAHIAFGRAHALEVLKPYFRKRAQAGTTFSRGDVSPS